MTSYGKADVVAALHCLLDAFATGPLYGARYKTHGWTTYDELFERYVPRDERAEHLPELLTRAALALEKNETAARSLAKEVFVSWNEKIRRRGEEQDAADRAHNEAEARRRLSRARACYRDRREILRRHAELWISAAKERVPSPDAPALDWPLLDGQPPFRFPLPWELGPMVRAALVDLAAVDERVWLDDEVRPAMELVIADTYAEQRGIAASELHRAMGSQYVEVAFSGDQ